VLARVAQRNTGVARQRRTINHVLLAVEGPATTRLRVTRLDAHGAHMSLVEAAVQLAAPWQSLCDDSAVLSTSILAVHLTALLIGGGLAVAADRATLRATGRTMGHREHQLAELSAVHHPVLIALAVLFASGVVLISADLGTFLVSPIYWIKSAFVALLLAYGAYMRITEQGLRRSAAESGTLDTPSALGKWRRM
jgi:hypothetical protein